MPDFSTLYSLQTVNYVCIVGCKCRDKRDKSYAENGGESQKLMNWTTEAKSKEKLGV
jgi:hypothetical protein